MPIRKTEGGGQESGRCVSCGQKYAWKLAGHSGARSSDEILEQPSPHFSGADAMRLQHKNYLVHRNPHHKDWGEDGS